MKTILAVSSVELGIFGGRWKWKVERGQGGGEQVEERLED
jgi:hypothetical protein